MKRTLSILLLLCLAFSLSSTALAAQDAETADIPETLVSGTDALSPLLSEEPAPEVQPTEESISNPLDPVLDGDAPGTPTTYTVTFETYGHCETPASQTVVSGGLVTKPADPDDEDLMFSRWCTFEGGVRREWDFDVDTVTEDITLVACFYWGVYFNTAELCATPDAQLVETGDLVTRPEDPTGEGLTFVTWYIFGEDGSKTVFDFEHTVVTENITLEASFLIRELSGISVTDRAVISLPTLSLGHYYLARFRSPEGAADTMEHMVLTEDEIALATDQEKLEHSIYYWLVGGSPFRVEDGDTIYCSVGKVLNIFDCVGIDTAADKDYVTQVCTLVCPFCYIVTINDGINETYGYYYFLGDVPALVIPEREGYRFVGWYYDQAFTQPYNGDAVTQSFSLYGKWAPITEEEDSDLISPRTGYTPFVLVAVCVLGTAACLVTAKKRKES